MSACAGTPISTSTRGDATDVYLDPDLAAERAAEYAAQGHTALKFDPAGHYATLDPRQPGLDDLDRSELYVANVREAVGSGCDLLFGTHGQFTPSGAIRLARRLEKYDPLWFEEPVPPEMPEEMTRVAQATTIPIATGERLTTKYEFARVLATGAASILQLNLGRVGGILEGKKIAGMAEAHYAQVAPHLYCGPVVGAANIQLSTCSPNFLILEGIKDWGGFHAKILETPILWEDGYVIPPTAPGLGVELDEEVAAAHPYEDDALHLNPTLGRGLTWADSRRRRVWHLRCYPIREARRAQLGAKRVLEQLDHHRRPRRATVFLPGTSERLADERSELEGHAELVAELPYEAEILAGEVHREPDVVAAVQDHLALGLVYEAGARARFDHLERLREVETAALREHQRLTRSHEVDEGEHVRDHLDDRRAAEEADVEHLAADRLERGPVRLVDTLISTDEHGDLTRCSEVDAARDRRLETVDAPRLRERRETLQLVTVVRARVDPRPSGRKAGEKTRFAAEHVGDGLR